MSRILLDSTTCLMCVRGGLLLCVTKTMLPLVQVWDNVYTVHLYVTVLRKPNLLREKYVLWDCNTRMCIYMYTAIFNDVITHFSPLPLSLPLSISLHFHLLFNLSITPNIFPADQAASCRPGDSSGPGSLSTLSGRDPEAGGHSTESGTC